MEIRGERIGELLRSTPRERPAVGVREEAEDDPERRGRGPVQVLDRVRRDPTEERAGAISPTDRSSITADPSSSGCASGAGGSTSSSPCWARGNSLKQREACASGWIAEQTSWTNPGSVSSAERTPPPTVSTASTTRTERPAWASVIAAASPLGPEPTMTASGISQRPDEDILAR